MRSCGPLPVGAQVGQHGQRHELVAVAPVRAHVGDLPRQPVIVVLAGVVPQVIQNRAERVTFANNNQPLGGGAAVLELYVSEAGTWTVVQTRPNGLSCIMAAGDNWQSMQPQYGKAL